MNSTTKKGSSLVVRLGLISFILLQFEMMSVDSVILPLKFYPTNPEPPPIMHKASNSSALDYYHDNDTPSYLLSINEGDTVELTTGSKSNITINLNRAVPQDVTVKVEIFSGPNLIKFDTETLNTTKVADKNATTQIFITYEANTFGDKVVLFHSEGAAGHAEIVCLIAQQPHNITIDDSSAYISINIGKSWTLSIIISIIGWIYFTAWSLSFYFQVILNYKRKSVVGLNFDFLALNLIGFTCYSIYNFAFLFSREVQKRYYERNTFGRIPVEYNDLFFAVHAFVLTLITVIQCFIYERGEQKVSLPAGIFLGVTSITGIILYITSLFNQMTALDVVLYLSYVKLAITLIKYTPQAYYNYQRKATTGWSIHNILLDFTGGLFSLAQMFFLSYNYNDWISIFGNFTKFGLGVISISFDIIFVVQHYVLYKQGGTAGPNEVAESNEENIPSPVISEFLRSSNQRSPQHQAGTVEEDTSVNV